jgi:RND family efflux transporter MFP subunit
MRSRSIAIALATVALAAAAYRILGFGNVEVVVVTPQIGTAAEIVYATGAVEPVRWSKVTSLVRNRIVEICDCEGKQVAKGDVLARLEDRELRAQLGELKAREEFAKREQTRTKELRDRQIATPQALERISSELSQIQSLIAAQTEKIAEYTIRSPMDGVVLRRDGEVGEIVEAGQILFRVGLPKPLQVVAEVNEEDIPRVAVAQRVLFRTDAFPDRALEGKVREITPMGDPVAKTYRVRIDLPDDTPLAIGMSVEANIVTKEKAGVLLVASETVQSGEVMVVEGSRARKRAVVMGIRGTRAAEIVSGLSEKDRVISPYPSGMKEGTSVSPRPAASSSAAR